VFAVYNCIQDEHDLRLVAVAGVICLAASMAVPVLLRQARDAAPAETLRWLAAAGITSGFGIWATHFVAMLGYDPGVVAGYALMPTMASLLVAIAATTAGFWIALQSSMVALRCAAGGAVGMGIAAMHYVGMHAVAFPGEVRWSLPFVLASILFAVAPVTPALFLALDRQGRMAAMASALLMALAILLLHFTGMAGIDIIPSRVQPPSAMLLSPFGVGIAVAGTAFGVLLIGMMAALISSRARIAIRASELEFEVLVQGISDCAIYMLSPDGRVASWNPGAERLNGYSSEEAIGLDLASFYSLEERAAGAPQDAIDTALRTGKFTGVGWRYRKDGTRFWAQVTMEPIYRNEGDLVGYAKITRDMTRQKGDEDRLTALARNLDAAVSNMAQGICLYDEHERLVLSNGRVEEMFGLAPGQCPPGTSFLDIVRVALELRTNLTLNDDIVADVYRRHRALLDDPQGGTVVAELTGGLVLSISYRPLQEGGFVAVYEDITERRRWETRLAYMAMHDGLTHLPNRANFNERIDADLIQAQSEGSQLAVITIDLDGFKDINDAHGHAVGDEVLRLLAERMSAAVSGREVVSRFGGDEFAVSKPFSTEAELHDLIGRLEASLLSPLDVPPFTIEPGASLGIAVYPDDGTTREQLLNNADLAMYRAKASIGQRVCFYEPRMDESARFRRALTVDLRRALLEGEFELAYQVQTSLQKNEIVGYEALIRWNHPNLGTISPAVFIPVAEESGDILAIGEWVLRTACSAAASWDDPHRVAVNLSAVQMAHGDPVSLIREILVETGLSPARLELEITESTIIGDKVRGLHILRQIKALGVRIAIDDFGTGFSSLDTLHSFPIDKIKIDRSFLVDTASGGAGWAIIRAVLALGRSLGIPVLAEGIETDGQLELLRAEGCDEGQGFLLGHPQSLNALSSQPAGRDISTSLRRTGRRRARI
jgi:diguanylate cyclase (GGDEF)-like protein/PAS domain S-box-containing protein